MNDQLSPEEQQALDETTRAVAADLSQGKNPDAIVNDMVQEGWSQEDARALVDDVHHELQVYMASPEGQRAAQQAASRGGFWESGGSWLVWIGAILLINFLSWMFNWGFWCY